MTMLNKDSSDPSLTRPSVLWLGMDLKISLFKQGWHGGGGILVVDLRPQAPPLRRRLLQCRRGAWGVVQERMQNVVCIDDIWKTEYLLGSWFVDGRYGFLLGVLVVVECQIWSSMACPGCCPGLIRSTARASLLVSHHGGLQSCISAMDPRRARVRR